MSSDGTPVQMSTTALQNIAAQNSTGIIGIFTYKIEYDGNKPKVISITTFFNNTGNSVTVMSPEGKPIQVNAAALQSAAAQNATGLLGRKTSCENL